MNLELLQQAFTVEVDFKQLVPSITEYNDNTIIQYDIGSRHLKIEVDDEQLKEPATYRVIKNRAKRWALGEL